MRHHYVPQFLLRFWTSPPDDTLQVYHIDSTGIHSTRKVTKRTGYQNDLWALTRDQVAGMEKQDVENIVLCQIDNEAALVHRKIYQGQLKSLTHEERCSWVRFIMSLRVRDPDIVKSLITEAETQLRQFLADKPHEYDEMRTNEETPSLEEWTEQKFPGLIENFGLSFFHKILDDEKVGNHLLNLRWWVVHTQTSSNSILLGDRPCIFFGGIENPNLAVVLPIAPDYLFIATRGEILANGLPKIKSSLLVARVNDATVRQAEKYVYDRNSRSLRFVENRRRL